MFDFDIPANLPKRERYKLLQEQTRALLKGERDFIANAANVVSLLWYGLPQINWVGIYRLKEGLVLGPFQGKPACVRIPLGKGVCGTAAKERRSIFVPKVEHFPGHITCDSASRSEVVIPLYICDDLVLGVLDIDSPVENRFDEEDISELEVIANILTEPVSSLMKSALSKKE